MRTDLPESLPNVYRACESVSVTKKSACEPVGVTQETHDHNYFRTRSVVNKVHPVGKDSGDESGGLHCFYRQKDNRIQAGSL